MYHILIVDDEEKIRQLVKKYAAFEGHQIREAENGMDALEQCGRHQFDIVVMDVMMPELDGFSAVKELRKTSDVPVIMLSARGEEYDRIHGFEAGVDDYVVKPFSPKELMMRIDAVMKRVRSAQVLPNPPPTMSMRQAASRWILPPGWFRWTAGRRPYPPRSMTCWHIWCATGALPWAGSKFSPGCGDMISSGTTAHWTPILKCCGSPWEPTATALSPCGGQATGLMNENSK